MCSPGQCIRKRWENPLRRSVRLGAQPYGMCCRRVCFIFVASLGAFVYIVSSWSSVIITISNWFQECTLIYDVYWHFKRNARNYALIDHVYVDWSTYHERLDMPFALVSHKQGIPWCSMRSTFICYRMEFILIFYAVIFYARRTMMIWMVGHKACSTCKVPCGAY